MNHSIETTKCGYVAIIGRPNVGKSTLLNHILKQKISITSHKPQTTRHQILGIQTVGAVQTVYVDTPGLHKKTVHALNRYMNRAAVQTLEMVDAVGFVVEALRWTEEDEWILRKLKTLTVPVILIINKVDQIKDKAELLPYLQTLSEKMSFVDIVPVAARTGDNLTALEQVIEKYLPQNPHLFSDDQITDRSDRFLASELIREKIMRNVHKEIPYGVTVEIEEFKVKEKILHITALIWLDREGQKPIVIGEKGQLLKKIGQQARIEMEKLFEQKIFLQLWVKIKSGWSNDERALKSLGYGE
jgi:GTP-binding protein Era